MNLHLYLSHLHLCSIKEQSQLLKLPKWCPDFQVDDVYYVCCANLLLEYKTWYFRSNKILLVQILPHSWLVLNYYNGHLQHKLTKSTSWTSYFKSLCRALRIFFSYIKHLKIINSQLIKEVNKESNFNETYMY